MKSLYFSRFVPTWDLGGGSRRLMQLWELLKPLGCDLRSSAQGAALHAAARQRQANRRTPLWSRNLRCWTPQRREVVLRLRGISRTWSRDAEGMAALELAWMDDPIYFLPLFETLQRRRIPVIAVCHNLESLVPSQVARGASWALLRQELDIFSRCRLVLTISREETWLLNNLGIPCLYFPYYPLQPVLGRLLAVRRRRRGGAEDRQGVLMLVNAKNPQSGHGLDKVIATWRKDRMARTLGPLLVAGFGSEAIFPAQVFDDEVQLLGTLDNERFDELLGRVAACLCYQEAGSGALTRICELLIAGVPVLANAHAARSYHGARGLFEFAGLDDLGSALARLGAAAVGIPLPPAPDPAPLLAAIERVRKEGR